MPSWIEETHFKDLEACDPEDVVNRTGCEYDPRTRRYLVSVWHHRYIVDPVNCTVTPEADGPEMYQDFRSLFIIFYLIRAQKKDPMGEWISEKDIKGGAAFFRGPHAIPTQVITDYVKDDLTRFESICRQLGGEPLDMADRAFRFRITPLIPVAVLYWQGDEEFPGEAKLLYDKTIEDHLPLDIVYALAVEVCHAFKHPPGPG